MAKYKHLDIIWKQPKMLTKNLKGVFKFNLKQTGISKISSTTISCLLSMITDYIHLLLHIKSQLFHNLQVNTCYIFSAIIFLTNTKTMSSRTDM